MWPSTVIVAAASAVATWAAIAWRVGPASGRSWSTSKSNSTSAGARYSGLAVALDDLGVGVGHLVGVDLRRRDADQATETDGTDTDGTVTASVHSSSTQIRSRYAADR